MCGWHSGILSVGIRGAREQLAQVRARQVLHRTGVGHLVHAAAHQQVAGQRPGRRVVDHLVDLELVVAGAGLEEEVVGQVLDQVAGGEDVVAVPRLAVGILDERGRAAGDEVLRVEDVAGVGQGPLLACAGQHRVDRRGDELDVAEFLRRDICDEVVEGTCTLAGPEVERLERVVHEGRHLAELAAQQLLDHGGAGGVWIGRRRQLGLEPVDAEDHLEIPLDWIDSGWHRMPELGRAKHEAARAHELGFGPPGRGTTSACLHSHQQAAAPRQIREVVDHG